MFKANKNKGWTPDKNHHIIDTFVDAVKRDIECTETRKPKRPHLIILSSHHINTFVEAGKKDIEFAKTFKPKQPYPNLDKCKREAIKDLSQRDEIISNADKGRAVVFVDTKDYIKETERQLNNNYYMLPQNPTLGNKKLVQQAIYCFKKEN